MAKAAFLAKELRERSGVAKGLPVDAERIAAWCGLEIAEVPLDGFLGLFIDGGILIKEGQTRGQRRFTISHELGHFSLPGHEGQAFCLEQDILHPAKKKDQEYAANEFAAELLMPGALFRQDIREQEPSFRTVKKLASPERYDVSVTACALRLTKLTREPIALVCANEGIVRWRWLSPNFFYALPASGQRVPADTCAAAVFRNETAPDGFERINDSAWFMPREETEEVLESTFLIRSLGEVLSLIWVIEEG